jgi:hypothetical protein
VHARCVVNATGPFSDGLRKLSRPDARKMMVTSAGAHVALPGGFTPGGVGLIIPKTKVGMWVRHAVAYLVLHISAVVGKRPCHMCTPASSAKKLEPAVQGLLAHLM